MLIAETFPINLKTDQLVILTGMTWEDYEKFDSPEYNHYLISYLNHEITIISPGRNHERITATIEMLIQTYCEKHNIACFPFRSTRLEEKGLEGKEADTAYAFVTDKDKPDLAVEVNFTSGNINDLTEYKYLKIKEVWLWQNNEIKFYLLQKNSYSEIPVSSALREVESKTFINYVNRGFTDDLIAIKKDFVSANN